MRIIGLDIGASSIKAGIISERTGIFSEVDNEETVSLETNEFSELKEKVISVCQKKLLEGADPFIGIATAGSVNNEEIVVSAGNFRNYCNISWQDILSSEFGEVKVCTVNDGRASAWGEYIVSSPKADTHVHTVVGTGIGGGVIHKGELLRGDSGQAGYIGHIKVTPEDTPICSCGKMGCVESLASARGMLSIYNKHNNVQFKSFEEMINNFEKNISGISEVLQNGGYWLGVALGNVMNVLNPQNITVGGGVILATNRCSDYFKLEKNPYITGIKKGVNYATHRRVAATGSIICGVLENNAGMIGAANLVMKSAKVQ